VERLIRSAVCTRCGCACDDVDLTVARGRVAEARNVCALGRPWFLTPLEEDGPAALVDGIAVTAEEGAAAAASLLAGAGRPLIWGLIHLSCEAQRLAVELAERVGAAIDPAAGPNHPAAVSAFQEWGEVSATLGEVAEQRGLVVLWLADPERTHPRLLERWRIGEGDGDRLIRFGHGVPVDGSWTVPPGREVAFLWTLRELARRRAAAGTAVVSAAAAAVAGGGQSGAVAGPASTGPSVETKAPTEDGGDLQPLARQWVKDALTSRAPGS